MNKPELLAPAGSFECMEAAFNHGADAVYIGIENHNLRAHSFNFYVDELPDAILFSKRAGKKIYAVLNIMPDNSKLKEIEDCCRKIATFSYLPDAFIISDPGVLSLCREIFPSVSLHLSTQTGTFNSRAMKFWASQGIERIILPRELNIQQIYEFTKSNICETEIFIHGAMCVSYSGRCLMGAYLSGRHANYGDCPQPCRFEYAISPIKNREKNTKEWFPVEENETGLYIMNSKDLNTISIIDSIINTGVTSLKIEGRNKSVHYVSSVVKVYRAAIDSYCSNPDSYILQQKWFEELDLLDHRAYTTGFFDNAYTMQDYAASKAVSKLRVVGIVKGVLQGNCAVIDVKNPFSVSEQLNILPVNKKLENYNVVIKTISDLNNNSMDSALTNRIVIAGTDNKLAIGDIIRRQIKSI